MSPKTLEKRAKAEARMKKSLSTIHEKFHPKQVVANKDHGNVPAETLAKAAGSNLPSTATPKSSLARNVLMLRAKEMQIKNFRVLNKSELAEVTDTACRPERRDEVIDGAVARWKAGWSKNKVAKTTDPIA